MGDILASLSAVHMAAIRNDDYYGSVMLPTVGKLYFRTAQNSTSKTVWLGKWEQRSIEIGSTSEPAEQIRQLTIRW